MITQELIEKCKTGDLESFRELVDCVSPSAFRTALRIVGDEEEAKDVVQDTMLTIWQKIGKLKSAGSFRTWLYRILTNECYDLLRKRKRIPEIRPDARTWEILSDHLPESSMIIHDNGEIGALVNFLTCSLSPKQRMVFVLAEIEELPADEISAITGISKTRLKSNLYYARKEVNRRITNYLQS